MKRLLMLGVLSLLGLAWALRADQPPAGRELPEPEGGIFGTGIVGEISALGSIWVNGQKIEFPPNLPVLADVQPRLARELTVGETVRVIALPMGNQRWQAEQIYAYLPLVGPLSYERGQPQVLGNPISWPAEAPRPPAGQWVAVSGLWQQGRLMASKVRQIPAQPRARISGTLAWYTQSGWRVGQTALSQWDLRHRRSGDAVTAEGLWTPKGFQVQAISFGLFADQPDSILMQGYLSAPNERGQYTLLGSGAISYTDQPSMIEPSERGVFCLQRQPGGGFGMSSPTASRCP